MPQIVKYDFSQTVLFEYHLEMVGHIVRLYKLPHSIDTDIFFIIAVIAHPENALHLGLAFPLGYQLLLDYRYQRQGAVRRLSFHHIEALEVGAVLQDLMLDAHRPSAEIYCRPFQPHHLAPAQSVVCGYQYDDVQRVFPCAVKQSPDLVGVVKAPDELLRLWSVRLIDRVARNYPALHR